MLKVFIRWLLLTVVAAVVLYLGVSVVGWMLPSAISAASTVTINRPAENVFWTLTDYNNMALWQPQFKDAMMTSSPGDKPTRWRATYTDGYAVNFEVVEEIFPQHLAERISDKDLPFSGSWVIDIVPEGSASRVMVRTKAEVRRPTDRFFTHFFVKPNVELNRILTALKQRVEASTIKPPAAATH